MKPILAFCIIGIYLCQALGKEGSDEAEYVLNFDSSVYVCSNDDSIAYFNTSNIEVERYNETTSVMKGSIGFLKQFSSDNMLEIIVEKEISGRYEVVVSHEICNVCPEFNNADGNYFRYMKYFGLPEQCPFEPGEYLILDFVTDPDDLPVNNKNAGRYQVTLNFFENPDGKYHNGLQQSFTSDIFLTKTELFLGQ